MTAERFPRSRRIRRHRQLRSGQRDSSQRNWADRANQPGCQLEIWAAVEVVVAPEKDGPAGTPLKRARQQGASSWLFPRSITTYHEVTLGATNESDSFSASRTRDLAGKAA